MPTGTPRLAILVAEDFEPNRKLVEAFLAIGGHDIHFAEDGAEAVRIASRQAFDLILMDLRMPIMDGIEATRRIRALPCPERAAVPIVAVTANSHDSDRRECQAAGMDGFLAKPLSRAELEAVLTNIAAGRA